LVGASQLLPHAAQLSSVLSATHTPLHATSPGTVQAHLPAVQVAPSAQTLPQAPQLFSSVCGFTQAPSHALSDGLGQAHTPARHVALSAHVFPQAPQLFLSVFASTQVSPQHAWPIAQPGPEPHWHMPPVLHAWSIAQPAPAPHLQLGPVPVSLHCSLGAQPLGPNTRESTVGLLSIPASSSKAPASSSFEGFTGVPGTPLHIAGLHIPAAHASEPGHTIAHAPQLLRSVCVISQNPVQQVPPLHSELPIQGVLQTFDTHCCPAAQVWDPQVRPLSGVPPVPPGIPPVPGIIIPPVPAGPLSSPPQPASENPNKIANPTANTRAC
jgi:hypothetical protein